MVAATLAEVAHLQLLASHAVKRSENSAENLRRLKPPAAHPAQGLWFVQASRLIAVYAYLSPHYPPRFAIKGVSYQIAARRKLLYHERQFLIINNGAVHSAI